MKYLYTQIPQVAQRENRLTVVMFEVRVPNRPTGVIVYLAIPIPSPVNRSLKAKDHLVVSLSA